MFCSPRADTHTDRQTDTKVNTEDTLSGLQEFFLQPIFKDRSNKQIKPIMSRLDLNKNKSSIKIKTKSFFNKKVTLHDFSL